MIHQCMAQMMQIKIINEPPFSQVIIDNLNANFSNILDIDGVDINQMFTNLSETEVF